MLEYTWRWFGPNDPISLKEIKPTGASGIVTSLHQIPTGEVWTEDEILERKDIIEAEGFTWSVAESIPVHEDIKKRSGNYKKYIEGYKSSIRNLGKCGIDTVCYNFMPVLDWSRTNLKHDFGDGSVTTRFEYHIMAAFDLFILQRENAGNNYSQEVFNKAKIYFDSLNEAQKKELHETVLYGLPGSLEAYSVDEFKSALNSYKEIGDSVLRQNLYEFIKEISPVAEESGVRLGIHPDDPPMPLLGLPRIVSNKSDLIKIINTYDSPSNGITLCTGSLGAGYKNDLIEITNAVADKINFIHLRNVKRNANGDFMEDNHLEGDVDMFGVMKLLVEEQNRRKENGRKDFRLPMRPDHGRLMLDDKPKKNIYPGYSLYGRMRAMAELRGLEVGIRKSL